VFTFKPSHTARFQPQEMQEDEWESYLNLDDEIQMGEMLETKKRTISLEINDKIVSIMGVMPLPQAGGHVWLFLNGDVKGAGLVLATRCVEGALQGLKDVGYEWIQTPVRDDFKQGKRWAGMLGFIETDQSEDIMENGTMYTYWTRVL
jgi:hypothetical protein